MKVLIAAVKLVKLVIDMPQLVQQQTLESKRNMIPFHRVIMRRFQEGGCFYKSTHYHLGLDQADRDAKFHYERFAGLCKEAKVTISGFPIKET